jgi:glutathione S-transferase
MPRPDLKLLPVNYRRIPILAIGRDIYLDTRLILRKLESRSFPSPPLGATNPQDVFIEKLLEKYMIEGPVFGVAAGLIPPESAQDPGVKKDRQGFLGKTWEKEELDEGRAECLNYIRNLYRFFETTILADGRKWVLGGEKPKLADIEGEYKVFLNPYFYGQFFPWAARCCAAGSQMSLSIHEDLLLYLWAAVVGGALYCSCKSG